jgi:hypothetical protein
MTISKEHRANIEAAIKETEYKYFGMYEFTEAQHNAVDLLVSVAQAMLDDEAALESRALAERKQEPVGYASKCEFDENGKLHDAAMVNYKPEDGDVPLFTHPTPDDAARYPHAAIGAALIATGLYDRMSDITGGDREARKLIEELIATVDPVLDRWHKAAIDRARQSGEEGK